MATVVGAPVIITPAVAITATSVPTITATGVAAITAAPTVGAIATTPAVIATIISVVTRRAIATIAPIRLNGARQGPHYQHCENSAQHDTSPVSLGGRILRHICPCAGIQQAIDRKLVNDAIGFASHRRSLLPTPVRRSLGRRRAS